MSPNPPNVLPTDILITFICGAGGQGGEAHDMVKRLKPSFLQCDIKFSKNVADTPWPRSNKSLGSKTKRAAKAARFVSICWINLVDPAFWLKGDSSSPS
jgi:hypothetical protein